MASTQFASMTVVPIAASLHSRRRRSARHLHGPLSGRRRAHPLHDARRMRRPPSRRTGAGSQWTAAAAPVARFRTAERIARDAPAPNPAAAGTDNSRECTDGDSIPSASTTERRHRDSTGPLAHHGHCPTRSSRVHPCPPFLATRRYSMPVPQSILQSNVDSLRYAKCVEVSKRIRWDIDRDVIRGRELRLHARGSCPTACRRSTGSPFLSADERRLLSQVQGRTYANMFGLVERFIAAKVLEVSREHCAGRPERAARRWCASPTKSSSTRSCSAASRR